MLPEHEKLFRELAKDINIKDERGKIISLHLYITYWLEETMKKFAGGIQKIKRKLNFPQKARLSEAVELIDNITLDNLLTINKLRNLYAHSLKPDENEKNMLITQLTIKPQFRGEGVTRLEMVYLQTILELNEIYDVLSDEDVQKGNASA